MLIINDDAEAPSGLVAAIREQTQFTDAAHSLIMAGSVRKDDEGSHVRHTFTDKCADAARKIGAFS
jgi:hypothetical protein